MRVQELFTEFKKTKRRPNTVIANFAPFRRFFQYNRGKWPKSGLKITPHTKFLSTGKSKCPNF